MTLRSAPLAMLLLLPLLATGCTGAMWADAGVATLKSPRVVGMGADAQHVTVSYSNPHADQWSRVSTPKGRCYRFATTAEDRAGKVLVYKGPERTAAGIADTFAAPQQAAVQTFQFRRDERAGRTSYGTFSREPDYYLPISELNCLAVAIDGEGRPLPLQKDRNHPTLADGAHIVLLPQQQRRSRVERVVSISKAVLLTPVTAAGDALIVTSLLVLSPIGLLNPC